MWKHPITKYMKIIGNTFSHEFFLKYIPTPSEKSLYNIIKKFSDTKMQNMVWQLSHSIVWKTQDKKDSYKMGLF